MIKSTRIATQAHKARYYSILGANILLSKGLQFCHWRRAGIFSSLRVN